MRTAAFLFVAVVSFFPSLNGMAVAADRRCLKELLGEGAAVYGPFVSLGNAGVVENFAISGKVDFVFLDGEHSADIDPQGTLALTRAGDAYGIGTAIRVPSGDFDTVKRYVGTGVEAVIVPSIRSADDARKAVDATKYPPLGRRAAGVERSNGYFADLPAQLRHGNDRMLTVVMIETAEAVRNIDSIVRVPGIDVVHVGPADLALDLGVEPNSKALTEAIRKVEVAARAAKLPLGAHAKDRLTAQSLRRRGYAFFTIPGDMTLLQEGPRAFFDGAPESTPLASPAQWLAVARTGVVKYLEQAHRDRRRTFVSELDANGQATSEKVHTVALSRALYGFVQDPNYLQHGEAWRRPLAEQMADYLMHRLSAQDEDGPYFLPGADGNDQPLGDPDVLSIAQQAYGLCGLVAYVGAYRQGGVPLPSNYAAVARFVLEASKAFLKRFGDGEHAGLWDGWNRTTREPVRTKSFDSVVYPAVAFLMDLPNAVRADDAAFAKEVERQLERLSMFVSVSMLPPGERLIVEEFDAYGNPDWRRWKLGEETLTLVGHNFQAALFLLQMGERVANPDTRAIYRGKAERLLTELLLGGGYDREFGGVFDVLVRRTGKRAYHDRKAWWQNAEALLALELAFATHLPLPPIADEARRSLETFFLTQFVDPAGLEWDVVERDGTPYAQAVKGNAGKSLFHTGRLVRLLTRYRAPRVVFEGGHP